jgi:hypothetical protein
MNRHRSFLIVKSESILNGLTNVTVESKVFHLDKYKDMYM